MSKSQVDSNTDFVEQSNILDLLQQRQTLKGQFRFQFSRNKISIETRKELVQYLDFIVSILVFILSLYKFHLICNMLLINRATSLLVV